MYQNIQIIGRLGKDPEMRYTPSGQAVTNLNIATNRNYTNSAGEKVEVVVWFRVSAWGKTAENTNQYLRKGSMVFVEGSLNGDESGNPRVFTRNDGTPGASFEVTARSVKFLSPRNGDSPSEPPESEEIPF